MNIFFFRPASLTPTLVHSLYYSLVVTTMAVAAFEGEGAGRAVARGHADPSSTVPANGGTA